jgi:hypothetical protein
MAVLWSPKLYFGAEELRWRMSSAKVASQPADNLMDRRAPILIRTQALHIALGFILSQESYSDSNESLGVSFGSKFDN